MFTLGQSHRYILYTEPTDMRKSFDSLSGVINNELKLDPTNGDVFLFINKSRNKMKLLHWSAQGFNLYYKRLETGTFESFSYDIEAGFPHLDYCQLALLIDGISIKNISSKNRFTLPK